MKDFFTWFIAIVLLSLCLLEKEARKNAILTERGDKSIVQSSQKTNEEFVNQNFMTYSGFQNSDKMVAGNGSGAANLAGLFQPTR